MRATQYRGKRIEYGEWVYGYLIGDDVIVGNIVEFNDEYFNTSFWYKVRPETVGQFTGLTDRNGKEICEGDWFRSVKSAGKSVGTIKYIEDGFRVVWDEPNYGCLSDILRVHATEGEVVGNIYEQMD